MIRKAEINDVNAIESLADLSFGSGFLCHKDIETDLTNIQNHWFIHWDKKSAQLNGFIKSAHLSQFSELKKHLPDNQFQLFESMPLKFPLTMIETIAVHPKFKNQGIGKKLLQFELKNELTNALSVVWKHPQGTPLAHLYQSMGFHLLKTIPNYWEYDSLKHQYECVYCGAPPCHCQAMIYYR